MNIGVILRENKNSDLKEIYSINKEIFNKIKKYNGKIIGIYDIESISLCDGIILQGGLSYNEYEIEMIKYIYNNDIPCLGICLGMQQMSIMKNGILKEIGNLSHLSNKKYVHNVNIKKDSKLYSILKNDKICVNSRHKDMIVKTDLDIVGYSNDGIIEAVEDKNKKFFIGILWHPESLNDISENIFIEFFKQAKTQVN